MISYSSNWNTPYYSLIVSANEFQKCNLILSKKYTHETLVPFEVISPSWKLLTVPIQQILEGPIEVPLCEGVNAIKFCYKLGKNARETYGMLQTAFWPSCMNQAAVFEWHKGFKEGRDSVRDDERCGRSREVNTPVLVYQRVRVGVMLRF